MAEYVFEALHPVVDEENVLVHPGDVREFDEPPDWGLWELVPDEDAKPEAPPSSAGDPPTDPPTPPVTPPPTPAATLQPITPLAKQEGI